MRVVQSEQNNQILICQFSSHFPAPQTDPSNIMSDIQRAPRSSLSLPIFILGRTYMRLYRGTYKQLHTLIMLLKCSKDNVLPYNAATALTKIQRMQIDYFFQLNCIASICTGTQTCTHTHALSSQTLARPTPSPLMSQSASKIKLQISPRQTPHIPLEFTWISSFLHTFPPRPPLSLTFLHTTSTLCTLSVKTPAVT